MRLLVLGGTSLHDGAEHDLGHAAANGKDHGGDQEAQEDVTQEERQNAQRDEAHTCAGLCQHHGNAIVEAIHEACTQEVHQQLDAKVHGDQDGKLGIGDAQLALEHQEQNSNNGVRNGLRDVTDIGRGQRSLVRFTNAHTVSF